MSATGKPIFRKLNILLRRSGRAAIQTIVIDDAHYERYRVNTDFIQQYIFPGGMLPSLGRLKEAVMASGFRIGRCDSFGGHYAETLRRWRRNFEDNLERIQQLGFGTKFIRLWRLYLSYCGAGFEEGRINVVQLQLVKETAL